MTPVLGAVQLSVGTEKPVLGDALTQQRDEREGQQPSGCTGLRLPEDADDIDTAVFNVKKNVLAKPRRALMRSAISTQDLYCSSTVAPKCGFAVSSADEVHNTERIPVHTALIRCVGVVR